jgi:hypothetical protein
MLQRFLNWLSDSFHFAGGMFYWNARKSAYVWRGRHGRCPCQNESDDSIPGRVRCDAVLHWHNPARFQKICPLLTATPDGWRCSVHASAVRPFWGRVFSWIGLSLLALYLGGTLAVFAGLRVVGGAPVGWLQVAWPGKWHEIKPVQSAHLFRQAMEAFAGGRINEAHLLLTTARELDAGNYSVALMLAQISMFQRSYLFSDDLFTSLWRDHPASRSRTAVVYHDTLLSLDRMGKLAEFSVTMAAADPARAVVWVRSALLAVRSMRVEEAADFRSRHAAAINALAPHAQQLLQAELDLRTGNEIAALAMLNRKFSGAFNAQYAQYQIERLAGLGGVNEAQLLLNAAGTLLGEFEQRLTQVTVATLAHDRVLAQAYFRSLLRLPLSPPRIERLATFLITHADADLYRELVARVRQDSGLEAAVDGATLWVAGIVCGAPVEAEYWQTHGLQQHGTRYPDVKKLNYASRDLLAPDSVVHLLNVVTLPRDVIMALLWRVTPQSSPAAPKRSAAGV